MLTNRLGGLLALVGAVLLAACSASQEPETGPIVLAAASLQEALEEAADAWEAQGHPAPALSFAGSSALARQVESGAPADLFVSADEEWMAELESKNLVREGTRVTLLGNTLVLIAPAKSRFEIALDDPATLVTALDGGRLAMADPDAVPAGRYGKAALERLKLWDAVSASVAPSENVRAALALVERGQSPLGVVYATDALVSLQVRVVARFPATSHPPIRYPAAVLANSRNPDAAPFLEFLQSPEARAIFARHGFTEPQ